VGNFNGTYITNMSNNKSFPLDLLAEGGWDATPHILGDDEAYTDAENETHRNIMKYTKAKINITTKDDLSESEKSQIMEVLNNPKLMSLKWWNDHIGNYRTDNFYMTEIAWKHKCVDKVTHAITYAAVTITLIAYKSEEA